MEETTKKRPHCPGCKGDLKATYVRKWIAGKARGWTRIGSWCPKCEIFQQLGRLPGF